MARYRRRLAWLMGVVASLLIHGLPLLWLGSQPPQPPALSQPSTGRPPQPIRLALTQRKPPAVQPQQKPKQKPKQKLRPKPQAAKKPRPKKRKVLRPPAGKGWQTSFKSDANSKGQGSKGATSKSSRGYTSLLPGSGMAAAVDAYRQGVRDRRLERALVRKGKKLSGVTVRVAELFAQQVSVPASFKGHLGFSRADVQLVNHPSKGLYLKNLSGNPLLRALLFEFLRQLPTLEEWQDLSETPFAIKLRLSTEWGERTTTTKRIADGMITLNYVTKQTPEIAKWVTVTESPDGKVAGGVNVLALLEPLLKEGSRNEQLRKDLAPLRKSPAFSRELPYYKLSK